MTIGSAGVVGAANHKEAANTLVIPVDDNGVAVAGGSMFLRAAIDNPAATTGSQDTNIATSVVDTQGNTWVKTRERAASAANTNQTSIFVEFRCPTIEASLTTSDTITLNLSTNVVAKAAVVEAYTVPLELVGFVSSEGSGGIASLTYPADGSLPLGEYLARRTISQETSSTALTPTTDWSALTAHATSGSGGGTNQASKGEHIIAEATSFTSSPTGGSTNHATLLAVYTEAAAGPIGLMLAAAVDETVAAPLALHVETGALELTVVAATDETTAAPLQLIGSGSATLHWAEAIEDDVALPLGLHSVPSDTDLEIVTAVDETVAAPLALHVETGALELTVAAATDETTAAPLALTPAGAATLTLAAGEDVTTAAPLALVAAGAATVAVATATDVTTAAPLALVAGTPTVALAVAVAADVTTAAPLALVAAGTATVAVATATDATIAYPLLPLSWRPDALERVIAGGRTRHVIAD